MKAKIKKANSKPGFKIPLSFRGNLFGKAGSQAKFNPATFKTQHKG